MAPDGTQWRVRRLWLPRLRRRRRDGDDRSGDSGGDNGGDGSGGVDGGGLDVGDGDFGAVVLAILLVVAIGFVIALALPFVFFALELLVLPLVLLYKIVFRRPFTVEARTSRGRRMRWHVVGWRRSGEFAGEVAAALAHGRELPARGA